MKHDYAPGFTLVEIAVVLVIIGLIVGAIAAGQYVAENARVRKVMAEMQGYQSAVAAFQETYSNLPGDMPDAYNIWGANCGANSAAAAGCNGDGDGSTEYATEGARAWQHLKLAELIEDAGYTGTFASGTYGVLGTNMPRSKFPAAGYFLENDGGTLGNYLGFGAQDASDGAPDGAVIRPADAYVIDRKLDDGIGNNGRFRAAGTGCTTYDLDEPNRNCTLQYQLQTKL